MLTVRDICGTCVDSGCAPSRGSLVVAIQPLAALIGGPGRVSNSATPHRQMGSTGQQASDLEDGMRIGAM